MPVYLASPNDDRELTTSEALSAAFAFFHDFDRRVTNQRVVDHVKDSAATPAAAPRETSGENKNEGVQR